MTPRRTMLCGLVFAFATSLSVRAEPIALSAARSNTHFAGAGRVLTYTLPDNVHTVIAADTIDADGVADVLFIVSFENSDHHPLPRSQYATIKYSGGRLLVNGIAYSLSGKRGDIRLTRLRMRVLSPATYGALARLDSILVTLATGGVPFAFSGNCRNFCPGACDAGGPGALTCSYDCGDGGCSIQSQCPSGTYACCCCVDAGCNEGWYTDCTCLPQA